MMFVWRFGKKQKKSSRKILGCIASANDHKVIVTLSENAIPYRKGQRIMLSIPNERKTASGKVLKVSEVVAQGKITAVSKDTVTILSKQANPIISKSALHENQGKNSMIFVEDVD